MTSFRDCDRCRNKGEVGRPCPVCGLVNKDPLDIAYRLSHPRREVVK